MNWIKKTSFILLILSSIIFYFGLEMRNIPLCGFGATGFLVMVATLIKKSRVSLTPIIVAGFTISFVELALILFWPIIIPKGPDSAYNDPDSDYVKEYFQRIDGFGYLALEGKHTSKKLTPDHKIIYDVVYTIGKDGYRLDVPYDQHQIFIYGGSMTFGEGLNDNETLNYFLYKNYGLYSKNMGIHGFGMHQALFNIQKGKTAVNGVNILLTYPGHATRSACKPTYSGGTPRYIIDINNKLLLDGVCKEISFLRTNLRRSYIFKLVEKSLLKPKGGINNDDLKIYFSIIEEIARLTKQKNSKLIIAYMLRDDTKIKKNTKWTNQLLKDEYKKLGDLTINVTLADTLEQLPKKYYIHELDTHPTAKANLERASILKNYIKY